LKEAKLKVVRARHTGFCFGVKRAVAIAEDFLKKDKKVYSIGPIIHNPLVVEELSLRGLKVISNIEKAKGGHIVVRSHGISPKLKERAQKLSVGMVDATCPFVTRSHKIVTLLKREGYEIIIVGEKNHPEVKALSEVAAPRCRIVAKGSDLKRIKLSKKKVAIVAQTTLPRAKFLEIASSILKLGCLECRVFDTICNDVLQRQTEAKQLAKSVSVVVVIGGKISANTRHLAEICEDAGAKTYHIETEEALRPFWFKNKRSVGVISGASTPAELVERVVQRLKKIA